MTRYTRVRLRFHNVSRGYIAAALLSLLTCSSLQAQVKGSWVPVWLGQNIVPQDFAFSDSLHGVLLCQNKFYDEVPFETSDGGIHWTKKSTYPYWYRKEFLDIMTSPVPGYALMPNGDGNFIYLNDSLTYQTYLSWPYSTLGQHTYSASTAFRLALPIHASGQAQDGLLLGTSDGWQTDTIIGNPVATLGGYSALVIDSTEIWCTLWTGHLPIHIYRTADAAATWQRVEILDSSQCSGCTWSTFVRGTDRKSFYLIGGLQGSEWFITHDDGATWKRDTFFDGHVSRLSAVRNNHGGSTLLALSGTGYYDPDLTALSKIYRAFVFSSSTDEGLHWTSDSSTFATDTLLEMHWLDNRHGFIASWRNGGGLMYRYVPEGASVAPETLPRTIALFPNPAFGRVTLSNPDGSAFEYSIVDVLGRKVLSGSSNTANCEVPLTMLHPGVYIVLLKTDGAPGILKTTLVHE